MFNKGLEESIKRIEHYREFNKPNWNGYDAEPISEKVILKALDLVKQMYPVPDVTPTGRNSIQFEWEVEELHLYVEMEIYEDKIELFSQANYGEINASIGDD